MKLIETVYYKMCEIMKEEEVIVMKNSEFRYGFVDSLFIYFFKQNMYSSCVCNFLKFGFYFNGNRCLIH